MSKSGCLVRLKAWVAVFALAAASTASAFSYVMPEDAHLVQQADGAIVGVIEEELAPSMEADQPYRRFLLRIESTLAGTPRYKQVVLRLPGSAPAATMQIVMPGVPMPALGDRVLLLYRPMPGGDVAPVQLSLGMFFESFAHDGARVYVRNLDGANEVDAGKLKDHFGWPRDAQRFETWIASSGAWKGRKSDYFATGLDGSPKSAAKFTLARFPFNDPRRLFVFDSGQTMVWQAAALGPGGDNSYDFATAVTEALRAWTDDPDSRINLQYGGVIAAAAKATSANTVVWDDPNDVIPGSYDCLGGILAVTSVAVSSARTPFDGTHYHPISFARIVTQANTACHFAGSGGLDGHELLTHEIGHALGLAHSCNDSGNDPENPPRCEQNSELDDGIMRARVHRSARGTRLGADDKAGVLRLYPSPTYVHPQEDDVVGLTTTMTGCVGTGSRDASSSADGSVIVFQTTCSVPAKAAGGGSAIFVLDRNRCASQLGTKAGDARCSQKNWTKHTKAEPVADGIEPSITADGRFAVFAAQVGTIPTQASVSDKREPQAKGLGWAVFMRNLVTNTNYQVASGMSSGIGTQPQLSPDGLSITFVSNSLPENAAGELPDAAADVFQIKPTFGDPINGFGPPVCASCKDAQNQPAGPPTVSANGEMVSYNLGNALLLSNIIRGTSSVIVPANAGVSAQPSMDYSGNNIVFQTTAPLDQSPGNPDTNGKPDVYTFQPCCNKFDRVSKPDVNAGATEEMSEQPVISGDGRSIAFVSTAQNLMGFTPQSNPNANVYVYDVRNRLKRRYSRASDGSQSNGASARPYLSYTGSMVQFDSAATNLDGADANGVQDVFQRANPLAEFVVFGSGFD